MFIKIIILISIFYIFYNIKYIEGYNVNKNIEYVAWTGGFDSTFLICKFLFIEKKIVQPIYINPLNIDNCNECDYKRTSMKKEIKIMNNIINYIKNNYPNYSKKLLPIIFVKNVKKNEKITNYIFKKLKIYTRKYNQYEAIARYSYANKLYINIGTVGIMGEEDKLRMDKWGIYLRNNLKKKNNNYKILDKKNPLYYIKFPIAFLSKKKLLKISKKYKFDKILFKTWSCWFPINGKPCGKCPMCKERIIPQI